jgi:hypothetical protein
LLTSKALISAANWVELQVQKIFVTNLIGSRCVSVPEPSSCLHMFIFLLTAELS